MKYDVTHTCGHTSRVELFGKNADREKRLAWLERTVCPDCIRAEQNEAAIEQGLPELVGSEKQIAWALSLREKAIAAAEEEAMKIKAQLDEIENSGGIEAACRAEAAARGLDEEALQAAIARGKKVIAELEAKLERGLRLRTETSAKWFIDHR